MSRYIAPLAFLALTGCSHGIASLSCADVAKQAVGISKGVLGTVSNPVETNRDEQHLTCHGTGYFTNGEVEPIRFEAVKSADGIFIRYDDTEYQTGQQAKQDAQDRQDEDRREREGEQTLARVMGTTSPQ